MYKRILIIGTVLLGLVSLVALSVPFIFSLSPIESSLGRVPHVDVSSMEIGDVKEYRGSYLHIFITKEEGEDNFNLVAIPHWDGKYRMPEFDWNRAFLPCSDFGVSPASVYECRDSGDFWWSYMRWDLDGNYIGDNQERFSIPAMIKPRYKIMGNRIVLFGS